MLVCLGRDICRKALHDIVSDGLIRNVIVQPHLPGRHLDTILNRWEYWLGLVVVAAAGVRLD